MDMADSLTPRPDELRNVKATRVGEDKLRRMTDDLLQLYTVLDVKKVVMPRFFVADAKRVPTFKDFQLCAVTASISTLSTKVAELSDKLVSVTDVRATVESHAALFASMASTSASAGDGAAVTAGIPGLWSTIIGGKVVVDGSKPSVKPGGMSLVPPGRRVVGSRAVVDGQSKLVSSSPKSSSDDARPKMWHIFIGRAKKESTVADIKEYLELNDITVKEVRKLEAKATWQENSAAYRVSVPIEFKDAIMDAGLWPDSITVRDWFFKPK
jgi:hypothetical protein